MSALRGQTEDTDFPPRPLRDYALLADGERGALVGPRGEICWLCAPRWHDAAVFSTLIGGQGLYSVTPRGRSVSGGYYEQNSLIWRSRWVTEEGIAECREALAFPGEPGRLVLVRQVLAREGPARIRTVLHPLGGYGSEPMRDIACHDGVWTARVGELYLRWSAGAGARLTHPAGAGPRLTLDTALNAGDQYGLVLEISTSPPHGRPPDADRALADTARAWDASAPTALNDTIAVREARQAHAVLRGLTSSSGGMVAAATTSLPEHAEEGRNYDYRYVWIRDQCYTGQAMAAAGAHGLLDDAVRFVGARLCEDGPTLAPAYTTDGGPVPDQQKLELPGYPGGFDLIGNHVNRQFQLDAFGEALLLLGAAARVGRLDRDGWRAAKVAADTISRRWTEADAGIWELEDRHWTHSRLICAAGLRRMAAVAPAGPRAREWSGLAATIVAATSASALHPEGHWQRSPEDPALDGALLLPPLRGALPASDPRTPATLHAYKRDLTSGHYAYRFRHDERPLEDAEGAFLLCGFVTALAEHQQGQEVEAHRWFERSRSACGAAGLYAEEYDIAQRQLCGNVPQAFVHALLLESAATLAS